MGFFLLFWEKDGEKRRRITTTSSLHQQRTAAALAPTTTITTPRHLQRRRRRRRSTVRVEAVSMTSIIILSMSLATVLQAWSPPTASPNPHRRRSPQPQQRDEDSSSSFFSAASSILETPVVVVGTTQRILVPPNKKSQSSSTEKKSSSSSSAPSSRRVSQPPPFTTTTTSKSPRSSSLQDDDDNLAQKEESTREAIWKPPKLRYYAILGVPSNATTAQIKGQYRKLAKIYHPDANPDYDTTEAFSLLNRAYEVLMHPDLRQRYDTFGMSGVGTSALSDEQQAAAASAVNSTTTQKDWTEVLLDPHHQGKIMATPNQNSTGGDHQDVKWKAAPPEYHEGQLFGGGVRQVLNEERTYGSVVEDYSSLANTNWDDCMKNQMDETLKVRPNHANPCLYQLLGVPPQATAEELQQAFLVATQDYSPTMDLTVGDHRQIYKHYHRVKKAYDILKIPALRQKYNQYGFEGLSHLKYSQSKVANHYDTKLSQGWDPDGPSASQQYYSVGARVLNAFCAPNLATHSFASSGVEYQRLGDLGAIVATAKKPTNGDNDDDEAALSWQDTATVLTGGGSMGHTSSATTPTATFPKRQGRRQKFFTIAPLPVGETYNFQAAAKIPLEDLFEMGEDEEFLQTEGGTPIIIAGPSSNDLEVEEEETTTRRIMPRLTDDVTPIAFENGAKVTTSGARRVPPPPPPSGGTIQMAPLIDNMKPIAFQDGGRVAMQGGGTQQQGGKDYHKTPPVATSNEPIPFPNLDQPPSSIVQPLSVAATVSSTPHSTLSQKKVPSSTSLRPTPITVSPKQNRQKFFTIAPLAVGETYQRAPKLSHEDLFEEDNDDESTPISSAGSIPFPDLESMPKVPKTQASTQSKPSTTPSLSIYENRKIIPTASGGTAITTTSKYPLGPKRSLQKVRLYTIPPLPVGQAYQRAPSIDKSELFEIWTANYDINDVEDDSSLQPPNEMQELDDKNEPNNFCEETDCHNVQNLIENDKEEGLEDMHSSKIASSRDLTSLLPVSIGHEENHNDIAPSIPESPTVDLAKATEGTDRRTTKAAKSLTNLTPAELRALNDEKRRMNMLAERELLDREAKERSMDLAEQRAIEQERRIARIQRQEMEHNHKIRDQQRQRMDLTDKVLAEKAQRRKFREERLAKVAAERQLEMDRQKAKKIAALKAELLARKSPKVTGDKTNDKVAPPVRNEPNGPQVTGIPTISQQQDEKDAISLSKLSNDVRANLVQKQPKSSAVFHASERQRQQEVAETGKDKDMSSPVLLSDVLRADIGRVAASKVSAEGQASQKMGEIKQKKDRRHVDTDPQPTSSTTPMSAPQIGKTMKRATLRSQQDASSWEEAEQRLHTQHVPTKLFSSFYRKQKE